jgi:RES domain-containing protein
MMTPMKSHPEAERLEALFRTLTPKARPVQQTFFRVVAIEYANSRDLLSGEGTRRFGGRWTPPESFETTHASFDPQTALAESLGIQHAYGIPDADRLPLALVAVDCRLQAVLDLTDRVTLGELALTRRRLLRCRWRASMERGREALTQAVGRVAHAAGLEALVVSSAVRRKGKNLIVFPGRLRRGSSLAIRNVDKLPPPDG